MTSIRHRLQRRAATSANRITRRVTLLCMLFSAWYCFAASAPSVAQPGTPQDGFASLENDIRKQFASGDYYRLYDSIETLLLSHPDRPESFLYYFDLTRLKEVHGHARVAATLEKMIDTVTRGTSPHRNIIRLTLLTELERLLLSHDRPRAAAVTRQLAPLRSWTLIGPFYQYGAADYTHAFPPELSIRLRDKNIRSKALTVADGDGTVDLARYCYPDYGVGYAVTTFDCAGEVKLRLYADSPYKLFVNGREVLRNHPAETSRRLRVMRVWGPRRITVMVKLLKRNDWKFRMLVTDGQDAIVPIANRPDAVSLAPFESVEELDHPFGRLSERARGGHAQAHFALGTYFDELNSRESIAHYRSAVTAHADPFLRYSLAAALVEYSGNDPNSSLYSEGWAIFDSLMRDAPDFIPARFKGFQRSYDRRDYLGAFRAGRELVARSPRFLPLRTAFARFLRDMSFEKEFLDELNSFADAFPSSTSPPRLRAAYLKNRHPRAAEDILASLARQSYDRGDLTTLIALYRKRGAYRAIVDLLKQCDADRAFRDELIEALIELGDDAGARSEIFAALNRRHDPFLYLKLGELYYRRGADPSAHWDKMLALKPSMFGMIELIEFLSRRRIDRPLRIEPSAATDAILTGLLSDTNVRPSRILYRGRTFQLTADGGSRVFCEDVYLVKDQKNQDRWGEYQVAFDGTLHPVRVRVYQSDGGFSDSYRIEKVNGKNHITLSSLSIGSVVHIAYLVDQPIAEPHDSRFFSIPITPIARFEEPVDRCVIGVIAPADHPVRLQCSRPAAIERTTLAHGVLQQITISDLPGIRQEYNSGAGIAHLPWYAFSSMRDLNDFVAWYNGLALGAARIDTAAARRFRGDTVRATVERVYDFVARDVDLMRNVLYYPDTAENTLLKMRGTAEDKAHLAKSLFAAVGIRSFIAFARDRHLPPVGDLIGPDCFSHILLFVPLDNREGLWLDFSGQFFRCGTVLEELEGTEAVVLLGSGYAVKTVTDGTRNGMTGTYRITLDMTGAAAIRAEITFEGRNASIRKSFLNRTYWEDQVGVQLGQIFPSISIDDFQVANAADYARPFVIRARGTSDSFATIGTDRMIMQPIAQGSRVLDYLNYETRNTALVIRNAISEDDTYEYTLPPVFADSVVDEEHQFETRHGSARITMKKRKGSSALRVSRSVRFSRARIEPGEYKDFVAFCVSLKNAESQSIIITR